MRETARCLALIALALAAPPWARASGPEPGSDATAAVVPAIPEDLLAQLLLLADDACEVRYAPGTLDRAAHVETWLRGLAVGAAKRTRHPARLVGLVLGREDWEQAGLDCPYGMPCRAGTRVIVVPAAGDPGTVALWRGALGVLPTLDGAPLMGTPEEAASLAPAEAFAGLVAARDLVVAAGFSFDSPWVLDFLAHALNLDAAYQERSGRAEDLVAFWESVRLRGARGALPEGALSRELQRQAKLFFAAHATLGSDHRLPIRTLRKLQETGGGVLRVADLRTTWPLPLTGVGVEP